jgi:hypothetical protein
MLQEAILKIIARVRGLVNRVKIDILSKELPQRQTKKWGHTFHRICIQISIQRVETSCGRSDKEPPLEIVLLKSKFSASPVLSPEFPLYKMSIQEKQSP